MVDRYATQAGRRYEKLLLDHLRNQAYDVERLRLSGAEDEGDLLLRVDGDNGKRRFVIEAKRQRSINLAGWIKEAKVEAQNYYQHRDLLYTPGFAVVHHARGKSISESYVTTTLSEWCRWL